MSLAGWIAVVLLFGLVLWLGFAMIALIRTQAGLRARIEDLEASIGPIRLEGGLPVGRTAPDWQIETADGSLGAASLAGRRHVLLFADTTCRACDDVVPEAVAAAATGTLPPVIVIARAEDAAMPGSWGGPRTGVEHAGEVSDAFHVDVSPHLFVIDEGGAIVAQGGAATIADVEALVREGRGIQVLPEAGDG